MAGYAHGGGDYLFVSARAGSENPSILPPEGP